MGACSASTRGHGKLLKQGCELFGLKLSHPLLSDFGRLEKLCKGMPLIIPPWMKTAGTSCSFACNRNNDIQADSARGLYRAYRFSTKARSLERGEPIASLGFGRRFARVNQCNVLGRRDLPLRLVSHDNRQHQGIDLMRSGRMGGARRRVQKWRTAISGVSRFTSGGSTVRIESL